MLLLIGTRKGLFLARAGRDRREWRLEGPLLEGFEVYHAVADPREPGLAWAAVNHAVWGSHVYRSEDGGRSWEPAGGRIGFPADPGVSRDADRRLQGIWHLAPGHASRPGRLWAGVEPAALFRSDDRGGSWEWVRSLEAHPTRESWQSARGGLFLHSIQVDPVDPDRLFVAVSAGGCYRSEDGGESWEPVNRGVRADYLPDPGAPAGHNPHCLRQHPARPERLYLQGYDGVYRSDDTGESWTEITGGRTGHGAGAGEPAAGGGASGGLPSGFGYVVGLDPGDPDRCWVVPEEGSHMRCVCDARLRVYETGDAGASWTPRTEGLPQEHAYVSVLREALASDGLDPCGVYLGTSTGHLFASPDGWRWTLVAGYLPTILSVAAVGGG